MPYNRRLPAGLLALTSLVAACHDQTAPEPPVYQLTVVQGEGQTAFAASALPDPVVIRAATAGGKPARGLQVRFAAGGDGSVTVAEAATDSLGEVSVGWTLADAAGPQQLIASADTGSVTVHATATAITAEFEPVSGGGYDGCRLDPAGLAECWGLNGPYYYPPDSAVFGPHAVGSQAYRSVSVGPGYTCGLTTGGAVDCWGTGMLGDGATTTSAVPVRVALPVPAVAVSAGGDAYSMSLVGGGHSFIQRPLACALTASGAGWCWGKGGSGTGLAQDAPVPVRVGGALRFRLLKVGDDVACGLALDDQAYCFGSSYLGSGTPNSTAPAAAPALVAGGYHYRTLAPGRYGSCAISTTGELLCWGFAAGVGSLSSVPANVLADTPTPVMPGTQFSAVALGLSHGCALATSGATWCWGYGPLLGTGEGEGTYEPDPVLLPTAPQFQQVAASGRHTCGRTAAGETWCWGDNYLGSVGGPRSDRSLVPVPVSQGGVGFDRLSDQAGCGLTAADVAWCWGGLTGDGTTAPFQSVPVTVAGGHQFTSISRGLSVACALDHAGTAWCWGSRYLGQLGDGTTGNRTEATSPEAVPAGPFTAISAGDFHVCALAAGGEAWCWGSNRSGGLGDSTQTDRGTPAPVLTALRFREIATFREGACGIGLADSLVYCWGLRLGLGYDSSMTASPVLTPQVAFDGMPMAHLYGSPTVDICALDAAGTAYCAGDNSYGQLGDGTLTYPASPITPSGGSSYREIHPGLTTCALRTDGVAECWGANFSGEIGDGTTTPRLTPTRVSGGHAFTRLSGYVNGCGLDAQGQTWCWGGSRTGELGNGTTVYTLTPARIP